MERIVIRRPNRTILSCITCYTLKRKCDRGKPACTQCLQRGVAASCEYKERRTNLTKEREGPPDVEAGDQTYNIWPCSCKFLRDVDVDIQASSELTELPSVKEEDNLFLDFGYICALLVEFELNVLPTIPVVKISLIRALVASLGGDAAHVCLDGSGLGAQFGLIVAIVCARRSSSLGEQVEVTGPLDNNTPANSLNHASLVAFTHAQSHCKDEGGAASPHIINARVLASYWLLIKGRLIEARSLAQSIIEYCLICGDGTTWSKTYWSAHYVYQLSSILLGRDTMPLTPIHTPSPPSDEPFLCFRAELAEITHRSQYPLIRREVDLLRSHGAEVLFDQLRSKYADASSLSQSIDLNMSRLAIHWPLLTALSLFESPCDLDRANFVVSACAQAATELGEEIQDFLKKETIHFCILVLLACTKFFISAERDLAHPLSLEIVHFTSEKCTKNCSTCKELLRLLERILVEGNA